MTSPLPAPDPHAAVGSLWERITALALDLGGGDWTRTTPCPGWTVKDLVGHLSGVQTTLDGSAPQPPPPPGWRPPAGAAPLDAWTEAAVAARRDWTPADVLGELATAAAGHVERLRAVTDWEATTIGPLGPTTERDLVALRCYDLWVHLQDLRGATGQPIDDHDPSPGAQAAYGYVAGLTPWLFAKRARAPAGATMRLVLEPPAALDTVLALRDGRARFDPDADPGHCVVRADPAAYTLLVSGRHDEEHWRAAGLLSWDGDRGEEFVRRARLF